VVRFSLEGRDFEMPLDSYEVRGLPAESEAERLRYTPQAVSSRFPYMASGPDPIMEQLSPDRQWFLTYKNYNAWLRSPLGGPLRQITQDGSEFFRWEIPLGLYGSAAEAPWSPDGRQVIITRFDLRKTPRVPLVNWLGHQEKVDWAFVSKNGDPIPRAQLWIVDVPSLHMKRIDTGIADDGLYDEQIVPFRWRADGSEFLYFRTSRNWKRVELRAANSRTGTRGLSW